MLGVFSGDHIDYAISIASLSTLRYHGTQRLDNIVHEQIASLCAACRHRPNSQQQLGRRTHIGQYAFHLKNNADMIYSHLMPSERRRIAFEVVIMDP